MKYITILLLLSTSLLYSSESPFLPPPIKAFTNIEAQETIQLSSEVVGTVHNMLGPGIKKSPKEALDSSVGKFYVALYASPDGINVLGKNPTTVAQAQKYFNGVKANKQVKKAYLKAQRLTVNKAHLALRVAEWLRYGFAFSEVLEKEMNDDLPVKLKPTVQGTLEANAQLVLNKDQRTHLAAGELTMGINLESQLKADKQSYEVIFYKWLPEGESNWKSNVKLNLKLKTSIIESVEALGKTMVKSGQSAKSEQKE